VLVGVGVWVAATVGDSEGVSVSAAVGVSESVSVAAAVGESESVWVEVSVPSTKGLAVSLGRIVGATEGDGVAFGSTSVALTVGVSSGF